MTGITNLSLWFWEGLGTWQMQRISFIKNKMVLEILQRKSETPEEPLHHESRCLQVFGLGNAGEECHREMWISQFGVYARVRLDTSISFMDSTLNNSLLWLSCSAPRNLVAKQRIWHSMQVAIYKWDSLSLSKMLNTFKKEKKKGDRKCSLIMKKLI